MAHNMNPFDFVPFADEDPILKTMDEWLDYDDNLLTGYMDVQIQALSPVHICGHQKVNSKGEKIEKSYFYKNNGLNQIPGTSISGLLRSFIEAITNGWVSQVSPYYKKEKKKHAIGFQVVNSIKELKLNNDIVSVDSSIPYSLPEKITFPEKIERFDIASFLFGAISGTNGSTFRGRIAIEDANIASNNIEFNNDSYLLPDINNSAFMGGAHPSASSWWYQKAYKIQKDWLPKFIGSGYRGRKFYFHQDHKKCTSWYGNSNNWPKDLERPLYFYSIECLKAGAQSLPFRIYFSDIPKSILDFFVFSLIPGKRLRHKIGNGKSYGYGSIEFSINTIVIKNSDPFDTAPPAQYSINIDEIYNLVLHKHPNTFSDLLHYPSLNSISKILWYDSDLKHLFTYPLFASGHKITEDVLHAMEEEEINGDVISEFRKLQKETIYTSQSLKKLLPNSVNNREYNKDITKALSLAECVPASFLPTIKEKDLKRVMNNEMLQEYNQSNDILFIDDEQGKEIALKLFNENIRKALHFQVYREKSNSFSTINSRTYEQAI